jgi:hypothetical protein
VSRQLNHRNSNSNSNNSSNNNPWPVHRQCRNLLLWWYAGFYLHHSAPRMDMFTSGRTMPLNSSPQFTPGCAMALWFLAGSLQRPAWLVVFGSQACMVVPPYAHTSIISRIKPFMHHSMALRLAHPVRADEPDRDHLFATTLLHVLQ